MTLAFTLLASLTVASAVAAMGLRNLVHCALALVLTFAGLAGLYLQLDAQFVGLAQILVYIGAVAILVMFAILLTRSGENPGEAALSPSWIAGIAVAVLTFGLLAWCILHSRFTRPAATADPAATVTVKQIGDALMTQFVLPLEVIGLLLTAAMIGGVILAVHQKPEVPGPNSEVEDGGSGSANGTLAAGRPSSTTRPQ